MNIEEFKARLGAGGARPNQFRVSLAFPSYVPNVDTSYSLLVTGASLPASNVNPAIIQYRGREGWIKVPSGKTLDRRGNPLLIKLKGSVAVAYA